MQLLDGKIVSAKILDEVAGEVRSLIAQGNKPPKLVVVLVGDDPASLVYVRNKRRACEKVGIEWEEIKLEPSEVSTESIAKIVDDLNSRDDVHGILVQLPLPEHVYVPEIIKAICPYKDVDGFQAYNLGKMFLSEDFGWLAPCTPKGVLKILDHYGIDVHGMDAVVVGHSNHVGKPMSVMLLNRNATVTTCHIDTKNLKSHTERADLLVVAVGKAGLITADMVKEGAIVVDIGINRVDGKLVGDVDFDEVSKKASYITPVPGGVGLMTVACLMENTLLAYKRSLNS